MKPPDEIKTPEEMRNWMKEQIPWLNNPNNTIPTVDPADIKACGNSLKISKHDPVSQDRCS
jgi:hypothetical protein